VPVDRRIARSQWPWRRGKVDRGDFAILRVQPCLDEIGRVSYGRKDAMEGSPLRWIMVVLSLAVTLCTPLVRQVGVADDFARAFDAAAPFEVDDDLEIPDGEFDDDDGEGIVRSRTRREAAWDLIPSRNPSDAFDGLRLHVVVVSLRGPSAPVPPATSALGLCLGASQRHAWLQHFLF
jgi:hypothetical protein